MSAKILQINYKLNGPRAEYEQENFPYAQPIADIRSGHGRHDESYAEQGSRRCDGLRWSGAGVLGDPGRIVKVIAPPAKVRRVWSAIAVPKGENLSRARFLG